MTFVRGSLSNVAGIHGTSTRLGCHPTGGASASMPGSSGIQVSPSFTPAGAWGAAYGGVATRTASPRCASTTCVAGFTATRSGGPAADREATFTIGGRRPIYIRRSGSNDHKVLHFDGAASDVRIDRLSRMPAVCDRPTADTPANNFEVFA